MRRCPECGLLIPADSRHCDCGADIPPEDPGRPLARRLLSVLFSFPGRISKSTFWKGLLLPSAIFIGVWVLYISVQTLNQTIIEQMGLNREHSDQLARDRQDLDAMAERVYRIKQLAGECAEIAVQDIDDAPLLIATHESARWLALTGARDPDDLLRYTVDGVTHAIVGGCYSGGYDHRSYDDVRHYMLSR